MTRMTLAPAFAALATLALGAAPAYAHFIYLKQSASDGATKVEGFFGHGAQPDPEPRLLQRLEGLEVWWTPAQGERVRVELSQQGDRMVGSAPAGAGMLSATKDSGVREREGVTYRSIGYAQTAPKLEGGAKIAFARGERPALSLDAHRLENGKLRLVALWNGKPLPQAEIEAAIPGVGPVAAMTDDKGAAEFALDASGFCEFHVGHIEAGEGEVDGKKYAETRHNATLVVETAGKAEATKTSSAPQLPNLPEAVTSFGAATTGGYLYQYGGNIGASHSYHNQGQDNVLRRVKLTGGEWEEVAEGPRLQGLALVGHEGIVYRIGGFTAANAKGEEHVLHSQASVAAYDPASGQWKDLPPLPEPRSSFDATVLDGVVYVVGGWNMQHGQESVWHASAWKLDLTKLEGQAKWEKLPEAPFRRRALAAAAHAGKVYAIGGMAEQGGTVPTVDVYDPAADKWSPGPALVGEEPMVGFGCSAFEVGGKLYVSCADGSLQRLSDAGDSWEVVKQLDNARFFHRMVPFDATHVAMVGGSNMEFGWKFEETEVLSVLP